MLALLLPLVLIWDRRFPLHRRRITRNLVLHLLFTLPWSLLHIVGMVAMRTAIYHFQGGTYDFGNWPVEFFYEYLKDIRSYGTLLIVIYLYRFLIVRLQGKIRLLEAPDQGKPVESLERPERLLVKKLGKEFLINVRDIEWMEAAGNYINLHLGGRVYPLRDTMTNLLSKLDPASFVRVHRSYIVRLNSVAEIKPLESGDARICLANGQQLPVSRRYREKLKAQLT